MTPGRTTKPGMRLGSTTAISSATQTCAAAWGWKRPFPENTPASPEYDTARGATMSGGRCCVASTSCGSCYRPSAKSTLDIKRDTVTRWRNLGPSRSLLPPAVRQDVGTRDPQAGRGQRQRQSDVLDTSQRHRVTQQQDRVAALADFGARQTTDHQRDQRLTNHHRTRP